MLHQKSCISMQDFLFYTPNFCKFVVKVMQIYMYCKRFDPNFDPNEDFFLEENFQRFHGISFTLRGGVSIQLQCKRNVGMNEYLTA